jgi:hypothetical protein
MDMPSFLIGYTLGIVIAITVMKLVTNRVLKIEHKVNILWQMHFREKEKTE